MSLSENDSADSQITDAALVQKTLAEPEAFGALIERYEHKIQRYIRRLGVKNIDDQADVLQEIFIKVYRNLNSFDDQFLFSSWLYRIAHNEAISWYRRQKVRPEGYLVVDSDEVLQFVRTSELSPELAFDHNIDAELLNKALLKLDEKYRTIITLRYFEHLDYEEISDILKIPVGSVGTLLHRGKKQLFTVLKPDFKRTR